MKPLTILWQRLVDSQGQTCDRCGATYQNLQEAIARLEQALQPLDINITFETKEISRESFAVDPSLSNQVWIAGKPIEYWLGASVASSPCCSVCGDSKCRTIEVERQVFEAIPPHLIIKATLIAASQLIEPSVTYKNLVKI
jgi:hypothetical protein